MKPVPEKIFMHRASAAFRFPTSAFRSAKAL
jgi:hypothetical protein